MSVCATSRRIWLRRASCAGSGQNLSTTENRKYDDTLPALNLVLEPVQDLLVRGSYSKVMSRPPLGSLSPGIAHRRLLHTADGDGGQSGPGAVPCRCLRSVVRMVFRGRGTGRAGVVPQGHRVLRGQRHRFRVLVDAGLSRTACSRKCRRCPREQFEIRKPVNGKGGKLEGFEIQYQQPFTWLPGPEWLSNFGTILNYTNVESKVNFANEGATPRILNLVGLSEQSANVTLYYDNDIFSARVSLAYRDSFMTSATSRVPNDIDFTDESTYVDFSTSYKINDHFKVSLEALNLTDEYRTDLMDSTWSASTTTFTPGVSIISVCSTAIDPAVT